MNEQLRLWFNTLEINQAFGLRCIDLRMDGATVEVMPPSEFRNPDGNISGALLSGAADLAAGIAVTGANQQTDSATGDLSLHFLAPARDLPLRIDIEILRRGRRTCVPQVLIFDASGRLCVSATGTWLLRDTKVEIPR